MSIVNVNFYVATYITITSSFLFLTFSSLSSHLLHLHLPPSSSLNSPLTSSSLSSLLLLPLLSHLYCLMLIYPIDTWGPCKQNIITDAWHPPRWAVTFSLIENRSKTHIDFDNFDKHIPYNIFNQKIFLYLNVPCRIKGFISYSRGHGVSDVIFQGNKY